MDIKLLPDLICTGRYTKNENLCSQELILNKSGNETHPINKLIKQRCKIR